MSNTGERIKLLRKQRKMSQQTLADRCGYVSKASINKIELGKKNVPFERLADMAKALGTTQAYLLCLTDDPSQNAKNQSYIVSNTWDEYLSEASQSGYSELFRIFTAMVDEYGVTRVSSLICGYMAVTDAHKQIIDELIQTYYKSDGGEVWNGSI